MDYSAARSTIPLKDRAESMDRAGLQSAVRIKDGVECVPRTTAAGRKVWTPAWRIYGRTRLPQPTEADRAAVLLVDLRYHLRRTRAVLARLGLCR